MHSRYAATFQNFSSLHHTIVQQMDFLSPEFKTRNWDTYFSGGKTNPKILLFKKTQLESSDNTVKRNKNGNVILRLIN